MNPKTLERYHLSERIEQRHLGGDKTVPVLNKVDLLTLKLWAARDQDLVDLALVLSDSPEAPDELAAAVVQRAREESVWLRVAEEAARLRCAAQTRTLQDICSSILERTLTETEVHRLEEFLDGISEEASK